MANELTKKPTAAELDGFAGYTSETEGAEEQFSERIIIGDHWKFTNEADWKDQNDTVLNGREVVAVGVKRVVQEWSTENLPLSTRVLEPGEPFPDIKKMNEEADKSRWREGPSGQLVGPYQAQHVLYLFDPDRAERYTYPTATVGGHRAISDLVDKINLVRRIRGPNVFTKVRLSKTFMPTRYGGRMRPDLPIVGYFRFEGEGEGALPACETPKLSGGAAEKIPATAPAEASATASAATTPNKVAASGMQEVKPPSLSEEMGGDKVPW
jgi:hypothetical protein